ncbi:hypothetical protein DID88_002426 [Monilinia fructigena]|uniref:Uncharacterized protein n=1 Tax=Monilinia fructigena TaxID=38457 RepID=A0A395INS4_9HELO|nr:hypothetical protein DID88_002426 [Monilinia fructigena]
MFGGTVHIVGSAELMPSLQRQGKIASFWYLEAQFTAELGGLSKDASGKLVANLEPSSEEPSLLINGLKANSNLWAWVQHEITVATTESVYGPMNPYRDAKVEAGFWNFADDSITLLLTKFLPRLIASKAYDGRAVVVEAMGRYFAKNLSREWLIACQGKTFGSFFRNER